MYVHLNQTSNSLKSEEEEEEEEEEVEVKISRSYNSLVLHYENVNH